MKTRKPSTSEDKFSQLPDEMKLYIRGHLHDPKSLASLALTCTSFGLFRAESNETGYLNLVQAVIDNDLETAKRILDANPTLLLPQHVKENVTSKAVESQKTWQVLYAEAPLKIARMRRQHQMVEFLLPYFDNIPTSNANGQEEASKQLREAEIALEKQQAFTIRMIHEGLFKPLVNALKTCKYCNHKSNLMQYTDANVLEELIKLKNIIRSKNPVSLENAMDPALLLEEAYRIALGKSDIINIKDPQDMWNDSIRSDQVRFFSIKVIGYLQSLLHLELAKALYPAQFAETAKDKKSITFYHESPDKPDMLDLEQLIEELSLDTDDPDFDEDQYLPQGLGFTHFISGFMSRIDNYIVRDSFDTRLIVGLETFRCETDKKLNQLMQDLEQSEKPQSIKSI
ncbi:F-box protein [Fluoribacter gormanii]|uniref:F-box domain-containing protein n=1 Tax=Fluoribacter gormanii TaxID=464 RepID=A0A377GH32_9GAMM|nr:F-box protein [Fluoribacter gormanii]KTD02198.1 hypothetical protein Lgor_1954 [Fluoribacter gormanii]SIR52775.1 hypothetical protein SAMN05421777_11478 [Fluoribacter gormanii]STO24096.1 Uncharacterised protein [Fluoribacter gormanii]